MFYAAAFALFCLVCSVLAFTRHPIWGLYFYLATTFVFPPARWWGSLLPDLRWALLSAVITALAVIFHRGRLQLKPMWLSAPPALLLGLYAVWLWIQTPWALDQSDHIKGSTVFAKSMLAMWFVYRVLDSRQRIRDLMFAHVLGCGLLGIYAYYAGREGDRLDGVGGPNLDDSNSLGMYLATGAIVAVGLVLSQRSWRRYVSLAMLALIANGIVLANSRGAFLGVVAGFMVLALTLAYQHRRTFWALSVAGLLSLPALVDQTFVERMFTIRDAASDSEDADSSARSRIYIIKAQLQMFLDYPMGTGHRGTAALSPRYLERRWLTLSEEQDPSRSSHNTFMTALSEQGIPGVLIYLGLLFWLLAAVFRLRSINRRHGDAELVSLGAALTGALMVVIVAGLTADYTIKEVQFWLYAGLASIFWVAEKQAQSQVPARPELAAGQIVA